MALRCYQDLVVWQKAMDLVMSCYSVSAEFPKSEVYGLASQLRRASVSIPANIAEGYGRQHRGEYLNHLSIASGSLTELETHIQIAARLSYMDQEAYTALMKQADEVGRMLAGLRRSLSQSNPPGNAGSSTPKPKP